MVDSRDRLVAARQHDRRRMLGSFTSRVLNLFDAQGEVEQYIQDGRYDADFSKVVRAAYRANGWARIANGPCAIKEGPCGRPPTLRDATERNLREQGYCWDEVVLLPPDRTFATAVDFKSPERQKIADRGYTILLTMGDQESDSRSSFRLRPKLPRAPVPPRCSRTVTIRQNDLGFGRTIPISRTIPIQQNDPDQRNDG